MIAATEPTVGGLGLRADLGGFLCFGALGLGGHAAGVELGAGVELDLGVSPQEGAGDLIGIDADGQVQRRGPLLVHAGVQVDAGLQQLIQQRRIIPDVG